MSVCDDATYPFLAEIKILIRATVSQAVPFLGICLGGQLLADTLGGKVTGGRYGEKGIYPVLLTEEGQNDRLFSGIPDQFLSFQWHDDSFDLPSNGIRLACSEGCPNQAFRVGPCAWGTQFHPEVDEKIVREWSSWTESTAAQTEEFAAAYCEQEKAYQMIVHRMMCNFIAVIRDPSGITDPGNARH
jgi:GMP synthase-like glutamine amidotransferase